MRYVLDKGRIKLASAFLDIVDKDAAPDTGDIGLGSTRNRFPGDMITVTWSGSGYGDDQRVALASVAQSDFTWIDAHMVGDEKRQHFTLPDETGNYEVPYFDISNTQVVSRTIIKSVHKRDPAMNRMLRIVCSDCGLRLEISKNGEHHES